MKSMEHLLDHLSFRTCFSPSSPHERRLQKKKAEEYCNIFAENSLHCNNNFVIVTLRFVCALPRLRAFV